MDRYNQSSQYTRRLVHRNRRHFDMDFMSSTDQRQQILNRIPEDTDYHQASNLQFTANKSKSFMRTRSSMKSKEEDKKLKGISMHLTLPRKNMIDVDKGPISERNFNNFYLTKPNTSRTVDIGKRLGRGNFVIGDDKEQDYDARRKYEQFYFRKSMECKFDYSKEKDQGRIIGQKKYDSCLHIDIEPDRIWKALSKTRVGSQSPLSFSKSLGKEKPSSFENRILKRNENCWLPKPQEKTARLRSRRRLFKQAPKTEVQKEQVCRQIYFRRHK